MKKLTMAAIAALWLTCVNLHAQGTIVWEFRMVNYGQTENTVNLFFGPEVDTANFVTVPCDGMIHHYYLFTNLGEISGFETETQANGYFIKYAPLPDTVVGNSFVGPDGGTTTATTYMNEGNIDTFLGDSTVNVDIFTAVDMGTFDVTRNGVATPDHKKSLWVVEDGAATALSAGVYREGADKIVAALKDLQLQVSKINVSGGPNPDNAPNGDPLPNTDDITAAKDGQLGNVTAKSAEITAGIPGGLDGTGIDPNTFTNDTKAGSEFTFFTTDELPVIGVIDFKPSLWWPDWADYADVIREIILFCIGLAWVITEQRRFEAYFRMWWNTPEKTTKPEPAQIAVPGVGWGKQLATALYMTAALVAIVGVTIASYNSHLGAIIGSETMMTIFGMASEKAESLSSNGLFSKAYGLMNMFVPLVAIFQFFTAHYLLGWSMPATWTAALWTAKHVHI